MNKLLPLFAVLLLTGAGCAATTSTEAPVNTDSAVEATIDAQAKAEMEANGETDAPEQEVTKFENAGSEDVTATITTPEGVDIVVGVDPKDTGIKDVPLGETIANTVSMESGNFFFTPNVINAAPGQKIEITFAKNAGFHTFVIDEIGLNQQIKAGNKVIFEAPTEPGSYAFYCDIGSHRDLGMEGTLIVK